MTPEQLLALAAARGANLEAVSRGEPEWTLADVAMAASGLGAIPFAIALYSLAGDDACYARLKLYLLECLLAERERLGWASRVDRMSGERTLFAEELCELFLAEERRPCVFQVAPHLRAIALQVEPETWRRTVSHQYAYVASEYHRHLVDAEDHVRRRIRGH